MKTTILFATALLALPTTALAQSAPPPLPPPAAPAPAPDQPPPPPAGYVYRARGSFVAGAKVGAALPFDGLHPMASGVLELGWFFPVLHQGLGLLVDVAYTVPITSGTAMNDPRVDGGTYGWKLTQKELTIMPVVVYRLTMLGRVVPYVGVGPRVYLHQSVVEGNVGMQTISPTTEQFTQVGVGVPLGVGIKLGPGEAMAEFLFEWGKLPWLATGSSTSMGGNLQLGYRFML